MAGAIKKPSIKNSYIPYVYSIACKSLDKREELKKLIQEKIAEDELVIDCIIRALNKL